MSLILEALRKSEAERRRGQAPDLHAELPPLAHGHPNRIPRWAGLALAAAALIAVAWWWSGTQHTSLEASAPAAPSEVVLQPEPATATAYPRVDRIPPAPAPRQAPASPPAPAAVQPPPGVRPGPATATPPDATERTPPGPSVVDAPAPAPRAPAAPPPATTPTSRAAPAVPTVAELPAAERDQLPPLKLTMHMWNERPAQRFVILDGNRHGEGDRIGDATITRIDPDGVTLELNGRAVRLPLR
ncbi:general secretion pathway protein GspB [Luteimonas vadosa]|uniref:Type II secretion system protein GspB C-terminal domain-containing protein n=1 Tax=Luteimonas vadosa TaxID=1165507 RepID=A0ABP9E8S1_9GAMM